MRMSERTHGNATAKIQITFPICIPNMAPLAALQHEIEPRIRGHNVLFEQLANAASRVLRELLSRFRGSCFHRGYVLLSCSLLSLALQEVSRHNRLVLRKLGLARQP